MYFGGLLVHEPLSGTLYAALSRLRTARSSLFVVIMFILSFCPPPNLHRAKRNNYISIDSFWSLGLKDTHMIHMCI